MRELHRLKAGCCHHNLWGNCDIMVERAVVTNTPMGCAVFGIKVAGDGKTSYMVANR